MFSSIGSQWRVDGIIRAEFSGLLSTNFCTAQKSIMPLLPPIFLPQHSQATFNALRNDPPNRICFATVHANALKENTGQFSAKAPYKFSVPFREGVAQEFFLGTQVPLRQSQYGYWAPLTDGQAQHVSTWMGYQGTRVYLKDLFDCSIALGERSVDNKETELGHLFTVAKYEGNEAAMMELAHRTIQSLSSMKSLAGLACISCPPPRADKDFDLPTYIGGAVAKKVNVPFVQLGQWQGPKGQLKGIPAHEKWSALEKVNFEVSQEVKKVKGLVLLVDDIYQSGTTLNYLRSKLTAQGVARAASISMVKAARDTDNQ